MSVELYSISKLYLSPIFFYDATPIFGWPYLAEGRNTRNQL